MGSVYPIEWVAPDVRGKWPNIAKHDARAWGKFLDAHAGEFGAFAYNVAMGGVVITHEGQTEAERLGFQYSTALKIDAVGQQEDGVTLFEVRPEAQVSAVGAALCYTLTARRLAVFDGIIRPAIVCEYIQPDVAMAAEQLGITIFRVPA